MVEVNSKGTNVKIKAHILPDESMREIGFTDSCKDRWYYCKSVGRDTTFNVTIPKDGSDIEIITLDENFCQPYDYQHILDRTPKLAFALEVREQVEKQMEYLQSRGVISGHERGEYI